MWTTPKPDDRREKVFFAWFPLECEDGKTRWLCRVRGVQQYQYGSSLDPMDAYWGWHLIEVYPIKKGPK